MTQKEARMLLSENNGTRWEITSRPEKQGKPKFLYPLGSVTRELDTETGQSETLYKSISSIGDVSVTPMDIEPRKPDVSAPLLNKGSGDGGLFPSSFSSNHPTESGELEILPSWDAEMENQEPENSQPEMPEIEPNWEEV